MYNSTSTTYNHRQSANQLDPTLTIQ